MKILVSSFSDKVFVNDLKKNVSLVNRFVDEGNIFIIATGKNISKVKKTLGSFDLKCSYYICNDGATIFDQFMNVIYRVDINKEYIEPIYDTLSKSKYISDVKIDVSTGFVDDCFRATNKIVAKYNNQAVAYKIAEELNSHFPNLHAYVTTNYINIINNKISKGKSLNYLLDYYNLAKDQIYTIVKDENDISLSQYESYIIGNNQGSFKYCTKNFEEAIKKITNY